MNNPERECTNPRQAFNWFAAGCDSVTVKGKKYTSYQEAMNKGFHRSFWGKCLVCDGKKQANSPNRKCWNCK